MTPNLPGQYDVIVIGGGHAGVEAAWAAASVLRGSDGPVGPGGRRVALVTMDPSRIGVMSCNPAIGGLAKGQMVREIDALGGLMGLAIDRAGVMFKMLNTSKGAAVRGPRAQADKYLYAAHVQSLLSRAENLDVIAASVDDVIVERGEITGVVLPAGAGIVRSDPDADARLADPLAAPAPVYPVQPETPADTPIRLHAPAVVLTTGTFMRGLMHTGEATTPGGRVGEGAAVGMSATLHRLGFELGRLKTGTPPRLDRATIDWDGLDAQRGDDEPVPFSDLTDPDDRDRFPHLPQIECRITSTTEAAHELIRANLHRAPMYDGQINAESGPRYCPSIEDKVVRFADRASHHVFLEPESLHTNEIYCNGVSTSLPEDVQTELIRRMPGCEHARVLKWGYAVEYDMIRPHQIDSTCETKSVAGLFPAGQINGTSGYEEAGGQGLIAGVNAARRALGAEGVRLGRDQAYIGVMLDDLVTKTPREPYRMFTSRAEHRLLLRADNADERLTPWGRDLSLVDDARWRAWTARAAALDTIRHGFDATRVEGGKTLREYARRPDVTVGDVAAHLNGGAPPHRLIDRVMTEARYDGYIKRQAAEIERQREADRQPIPDWFDPHAAAGLRSEAADVLAKFRPATMGQASRLAGVNPADLTVLAVAIRRGRGAAAS